MAKLTLRASVILFYSLIFIETSGIHASDGTYFYETQPENLSSDVSFKFLHSKIHHLQKRQTSDNKQGQPVLNTAIDIKTHLHDSDVPDIKLNKTKITEAPKIFPSDAPKLNMTVTKLPIRLLNNGSRLLGVNGTGQRKQYPSTTDQPTVISNTDPPLLHDIASNESGKPDFDDIINNISISKFTDKELNNTLAQHNITNETITESYFYYNSTLLTDPHVARSYWVNLSEFENATTHKLLSSAHRRAATVTLSFEFPFYGHLIKNVTIATGGFLYTGDYVHAWLAATQYIAPLMANFDTSLSNNSFVRFMDNGTAFTVLWEKVVLKDRAKEGEFTFQTTLHKNGDIIFVYGNVPSIIENIKDDHHPVKVGLSDAYIIDSTLFFLRRKTIYEYHRVNFQKEEIKNGTVIILKALPTCLDATDCTTCLTKELSSFQCIWCPAFNRCSSGVDRRRQEWIMKGCDQTKVKNVSYCSQTTSYDTNKGSTAYVHDSNGMNIYMNTNGSTSPFSKQSDAITASQPDQIGMSGVLAIMMLLSMIVAISMWVYYAYRNPHTTSGQMLIRYRPSQWRWKRGEARYTAATIHM
ncbi:plexin domain-containing protein 2 [Harmonia axyridis]|uniref:plexin domain-containing protein 2 n=1 Tax=Harmonia axyridis TaxID=115357 RepID=UPI001E276EB4|nr:plexin domain-containing protein 2 [Harmonia axyridis]